MLILLITDAIIIKRILLSVFYTKPNRNNILQMYTEVVKTYTWPMKCLR